MRKHIISSVRLLIVVSLVAVALSAVSCSREKPKEEKAATPLPSPYSNESVFTQVQQQLKEDPNNPDALFHLAQLYDRNAQYAEAIDAYKKVVAQKPDMGYAYYAMGTDYNQLNRPEEAIEAFQTGLKYMPNYATLYNNLGVAYGKLDQLDKEIEVLKKALEIRPYYASARYNLAMAYMNKGNKEAAMKEYEALKNYDEGMADMLMREMTSGK